MSQILPKLFLGNQDDALGNFILANNIKSVVNVSKEVPKCPYVDDSNFLRIDIDDDPYENIIMFIPEFMEFMKEAEIKGNNVLIHCYAGISRSVSYVLIYLILRYSMDFKSAYAYVKSLRPFVNINKGFYSQVEELSRKRKVKNKNVL